MLALPGTFADSAFAPRAMVSSSDGPIFEEYVCGEVETKLRIPAPMADTSSTTICALAHGCTHLLPTHPTGD